MNRGWSDGGYTIVETLIVLAVTGALFVIVYATMNVQQNRSQFSAAIRETELMIQDVINDVATGYYANLANFECAESSNGPRLTPGGDTQGTNEDCIYLGRVIQFGVAGSQRRNVNVFNAVGLRQRGGKEVETLRAASPVLMTPSTADPAVPEAKSTRALPGALEVAWVRYSDSLAVDPATDVSAPMAWAVGFLTSLASYDVASKDLFSGSSTTNVYPLAGVPADATSQTVADVVGAIRPALSADPLSNPVGGIAVCFDSGTAHPEHGIIRIGSRYGQTGTNLEIMQGRCV